MGYSSPIGLYKPYGKHPADLTYYMAISGWVRQVFPWMIRLYTLIPVKAT